MKDPWKYYLEFVIVLAVCAAVILLAAYTSKDKGTVSQSEIICYGLEKAELYGWQRMHLADRNVLKKYPNIPWREEESLICWKTTEPGKVWKAKEQWIKKPGIVK